MSTEWRTWRRLARDARPEMMAAVEVLLTAEGPLTARDTDGMRRFVRRVTGVCDSLVSTIKNATRVTAECANGDTCETFPWCTDAHVHAVDAAIVESEAQWDEARRDGLAHGIISYPFYERGVCFCARRVAFMHLCFCVSCPIPFLLLLSAASGAPPFSCVAFGQDWHWTMHTQSRVLRRRLDCLSCAHGSTVKAALESCADFCSRLLRVPLQLPRLHGT